MGEELIDILLNNNLKTRVKLLPPSDSAYRALSYAHFMTDASQPQFKRHLNLTITAASTSKSLPARLINMQKESLRNELLEAHELHQHMEKYLFLMVSFVFEKRVIVYMSRQDSLLTGIYNFGHREELEICKVGANFYPVFSLSRFEALSICQQILQSLIMPWKIEPTQQEILKEGKEVQSQEVEEETHVYSSHPFVHYYYGYSTYVPHHEQADSKRLYTGRLKFFDEGKNYGFIIMDQDGSDIFVHYDDLSKANISREQLRNAKNGHIIRFQFSCMKYYGKYKQSRKAIDLSLIDSGPVGYFPMMMSQP